MKYKKSIVILLVFVIVFAMMPVVSASPDINGDFEEGAENVHKKDNKKDPLTDKQLELKAKALQDVLKGKGQGNVVEVTKGHFVELDREGEGILWTVLGEFADYSHNSIPEPDRSVNNSTIWVHDFNRDYYMDILFSEGEGANSMRNYYIEQSSGRYAVYGDVTDWITVPSDHEYYDDNEVDSNVWFFIEDSVNGWYAKQKDSGQTDSDINDYLSQFDVWDRYDYDGDGIFDEPDGYIDTFQSVHAGEGEEAGGGELGDEAIWSHSWYARYGDIGETGPEFNQMGGIQVGDSDYWIGKYTIQPENGGVGVFAHEYGHDMGLPDLYDYTGENGTGFWSIMSSGSWLSDNTEDIGSKPGHMGAWEKFQLGWLNYSVVYAGEEAEITLGPSEFNSTFDQAAFVVLPDKVVTIEVGEPYSGDFLYYSGMGNDLDHFMYRTYELPLGATFNAMVNYEIELDWDYAYLVVSTDGGATWEAIATNKSTDEDPNGQNFGHGITGSSGGWIQLTADLKAYEGQTVMAGFRYWTDGAAVENGILVDEIAVTGYPVEGAEEGEGEWTFDGFRISAGSETGEYFNSYICEYKTYYGYDKTLEVGPYNFGYKSMPDFVDRFSYQDGLLINYWDGSQTDNDTGTHPGYSLVLPIDAHFEPLERNGRNLWRNRIQTYDSTFSLEPTDGIPVIHYNNKLYSIPSLPAVPVFDDRILHYDENNPLGSVKHPQTGTVIEIVKESRVEYKKKYIPYMEIMISSEPVEELVIEEVKGKKTGNMMKSSKMNISESIGKSNQKGGKNLVPLMAAMAYFGQ